MLVLYETAAGFAVFKVLDEKKLKKTDDLHEFFESTEAANKIVQLQKFKKFADSAEALEASVALNEGKICKPLKKLLKKIFVDDVQDELMVWDPKLGNSIKEKLGVQVVSSGAVGELMRCIKTQVKGLIPELPEKDLTAMALGLGHNLARYKLKFSPDKVDTMVVQAISLLDDIDKELNNYIMRAREWYGWHFPELTKILTDNTQYVKAVIAMGTRDKAIDTDFSEFLAEDLEERVKEAAEISMGTEMADDDVLNINCLCQQIVELSDYRIQLYEYLRNRMVAIAPNLNILVGEMVGARLIARAGSLMNLAKQPASTIQILGAEKALFRALKTRVATPKYGLIYHAQMVSQCSTQNKGKMSRMLAAKAALSIRYDALGEDSVTDMGMNDQATLACRFKAMESNSTRKLSGLGKSRSKLMPFRPQGEGPKYNTNLDISENSNKRKLGDQSDEEMPNGKKIKVEFDEETGDAKLEPTTPEIKKKKKKKSIDVTPKVEQSSPTKTESPKKKKKSLGLTPKAEQSSPKKSESEKKKKKKKSLA